MTVPADLLWTQLVDKQATEAKVTFYTLTMLLGTGNAAYVRSRSQSVKINTQVCGRGHKFSPAM